MRKIAVVGLGYVGLTLAVELSKHYSVTGYDISEIRINELIDNWDRNDLLDKKSLHDSIMKYTSNKEDLNDINLFIVSVSTPAYFYEQPNLEPLLSATRTIAEVLKRGDIVVYESTVYPGATEELCLPILEKISHLCAGKDFNIAYSPERISPGDSAMTLKNIVKIVAAQNPETLSEVQQVYESVCDRVYCVSSIATAEATKLLENLQRDVNIAFMNEFSQIMNALNLNVYEIIEAAKTKWSFVPFKPGLVGGHCIAVDPHYLIFKAKRLGLHPDMLLTARKINDGMPQYIVNEALKLLMKNDLTFSNCKMGIFGLSYKEDVNDLRNSLALKLVGICRNLGFNYLVHDPVVDEKIVLDKYQIKLSKLEEMNGLTIAIILVGHHIYLENGVQNIIERLETPKILMDIPNIFAMKASSYEGIVYWNL
jgi:UDP-N-acetyl-D-galactosamine dehydrogenase